MKEKLLQNRTVDLIVGSNAYRDLSCLLKILESKQTEVEMPMNVQLFIDETYADIIPMHLNKNQKHAWISIMRC